MEINIHNYESVLIDYFDGQLNALEVAEVLLFLEQHPEIKREFETFGTLPEPDSALIESDFKLSLKKLSKHSFLAQKSFNELIIDQIEGNCTASENKIIDEIIAENSSLLKLKNTFALTKLKPDLNELFTNKHSLKRKEAVIFYLNRKFAAAAALLLLATLVFLIYKNADKQIAPVELVQTENKNTPQVPETEVKNAFDRQQKNSLIEVQSLAFQNDQNKYSRTAKPAAKPTTLAILEEPIMERKNNEFASIPIQQVAKMKNSDKLSTIYINENITPVEILASATPQKLSDFLTIGDWMKKKIIERGQNNLKENEKPVANEELVIDPMTVASVGANIVEKTTGKKVFLSRSFDKAGSVKSYTFAAGNFKFERIK